MKEIAIFDDIRPYRDEEIPAAMRRIADDMCFPLLSAYIFPNRPTKETRELVRSIRTTAEFQARVMHVMIDQVIRRSTTSFTYSGIERLSPSKRYLFISNHRDIMLDAGFLQQVLYDNGHETSEITFGVNLMQNPLIVDIGKSNKMFKVERPTSDMRAFYQASRHLSEYIRYTLLDKRQSIWIAQRNGRTKDGRDLTDQGLIKMLGMSGSDDKVHALAELRIVPVAISYEWEPCDQLKTMELYERSQNGDYYGKKPGEDIFSIIGGILQPKGRVHLTICEPLSPDELSAYETYAAGDFNRAVANLVDQRIHHAYHLSPNNFIAHDRRSGQRVYQDRYTEAQEAAFAERFRALEADKETGGRSALMDILLGIYANPVDLADDDARRDSVSPENSTCV